VKGKIESIEETIRPARSVNINSHHRKKKTTSGGSPKEGEKKFKGGKETSTLLGGEYLANLEERGELN